LFSLIGMIHNSL